ncbi:MAG: LodA/GoxA family CTQ-dependent oxidase [Bryobacterales bacterium]|nr:LodA/GoxA family CTQ-dependent oxidase [Bryobacterales bacterium]
MPVVSRRTLLRALGWSSLVGVPPQFAQPSIPETSRTVRAAIHPAIGIARVGNSPDGFFVGPELPWPTAAPEGGYKDPAGAIKRQAARFRIYGYDESGCVTEELTAADAEIRWTVHVANKKAAWYNFNLALDIPAAVPCTRRNPEYLGPRRADLVIDPGPRSISGPWQDAQRFDTGTFLGRPVYLGELRTDEEGRLLFLGGHGVSGAVLHNRPAIDFANNDGWFDDIADGPVTAEVLIGGQVIPVDPAWVVVAPPNYAPEVISIQTMYDVIYDASLGSLIAPPPSVSFAEHIYPLLAQFSDTQWVNYGFYRQFGWGSPSDFLHPDALRQLASIDAVHKDLRQHIFLQFRDPDATALEPYAWPPLYGDAMGVRAPDPQQLFAVTRTQHENLRRWAGGDFLTDWEEASPAVTSLAELPLQEQPGAIDKAALHFCMGGPFHPGCEMTWPMRHASLYTAPFRLRHWPEGRPQPDYGDAITLDSLGPALAACAAGDLTRWMAVPWQTDTASCRAGYDPAFDPYLPAFWPARVPNHVLPREQYMALFDGNLTEEQRLQAFHTRADWFRWFTGGYIQQINQMITDFGKLGIVQRHRGPDVPNLPNTIYVESDAGF